MTKSPLASVALAAVLASQAHAAALPLAWPAPALTNPLVITIPATPGAVSAWGSGRDCLVEWPKTKHVGSVTIADCKNLVSIGGWNTVPPALLANGQVDTSNSAVSRLFEVSSTLAGVVHIEGFLGDASAGGMSDGIDIAAPASTVQIQNTHITGIYGYSDQFHADCIQPFGGVKALRVSGFTCYTAYQGLSVWPVAASPAGWTADIRDTNIVSFGAQIWGAHNSGGILYWPWDSDHAPMSATAVTNLTNVYLAPRAGISPATVVYPAAATAPTQALSQMSGTSISFPSYPITGHVTTGYHPGGDFMPIGLAGPNYVTPTP